MSERSEENVAVDRMVSAKHSIGWIDVNLATTLEHSRWYLTRAHDLDGSKTPNTQWRPKTRNGEIYAKCNISVDGDEVWFMVDESSLSIRVDEVYIPER